MKKCFLDKKSIKLDVPCIRRFFSRSKLDQLFLMTTMLVLGSTKALWSMQCALEKSSELKDGLASMVHIFDESIEFRKENIDYCVVSKLYGHSSGLEPQYGPQQSVLHYESPDITPSREESVLLRGVQGLDGRTQISNTMQYPYCCFGRLTVSFGGKVYAGSGVAVGPRHVLTAAHCVMKEGQWPEGIMYHSGLDGDVAPFGETRVLRVYLTKEYFDRQDCDYDFALLVLDKPIGKSTGYLGCFFANDRALFKEHIAITGYPADKGWKKMWSMAHKVKNISVERIFYDIDTYSGQSGSPIWTRYAIHEQGSDSGFKPLVVGIHTHGERIYGEGNSGTRLTEAKFKLIMKWIALTKDIASSIPGKPCNEIPKQKAPAPFVAPAAKDPNIDQIVDNDGFTRLHKAAQRGDLQSVKDLIRRGADVTLATKDGDTPLHLAAIKDHSEVVSYLLHCGADSTKPNKNNFRPLHLACWNVHKETVKILIDHGDDENAVLCWAAANGNEDAVKLLLDCHVNIDCVEGKTGNTPLLSAIEGKHVDLARLLLKRGANPSQANTSGLAPIHYISFFGDLASIKLLIRQGVDKNLLLHWAARDGKSDVVTYLIGRGADVRSHFPGTSLTPLFWAVIGNHREIARILLAAGAKLDMPFQELRIRLGRDEESYRGRALFAHAVSHIHDKDFLSLGKNLFNGPRAANTKKKFSKLFPVRELNRRYTLYDARVCLERATYEDVAIAFVERGFPQCSLLHCAVIYGHLEMAECLLDHGADVNAQDLFQCTPLHYASMGGFTDIVDLLLRRGAEVNAVSSLGETAICCVTFTRGQIESNKHYIHDKREFWKANGFWMSRDIEGVVKRLGRAQADFNIQDKNGRTPLHYAANRCTLNVLKLFLEYGANPNTKDFQGKVPIEFAETEIKNNREYLSLGFGADQIMKDFVSSEDFDSNKEFLKQHTESCVIF